MDNNLPDPGMAPPTENPGAPPVAPAAAPPAPAFTPTPAPPPAQPSAEGGSTGKGNVVSRFFEDVSFTQVGFLILGSAAMFMVIYYYRERIKKMREEENVTDQKIEEVKANVVAFLGPQYKSF